MSRPAKKAIGDTQRSIRVPRDLLPRIQAAMEYEGFRSFSAFCVAALIRKCRHSEENKAREEREKSKLK